MTSHRNHTVVGSLLALLVSVMTLANPTGVEVQTRMETYRGPIPGRPD